MRGGVCVCRGGGVLLNSELCGVAPAALMIPMAITSDESTVNENKTGSSTRVTGRTQSRQLLK